jgi:hypothetical protein
MFHENFSFWIHAQAALCNVLCTGIATNDELLAPGTPAGRHQSSIMSLFDGGSSAL